MLLLQGVSFSVINKVGTPSSELQINFAVLQTDIENSATGVTIKNCKNFQFSTEYGKLKFFLKK